MDLKELGEFGLIERIRDAMGPVPEGVLGIGDDCAILPQRDAMETLVTTDMLVEGTHFLREDIPAHRLGWKSAAVNFSDIAAMGGRPTGSFLSLGLPRGLDSEWMDDFVAGYKACSDFCGAPLLGGDTTTSPSGICINVAVLGECPRGHARLRSSAVPGDLVCVTGPLGDSGGGLQVILKGVERDAAAGALVERHYRPVPRVREGQTLAATEGVHAMMDISDGIASDLRHILKASRAGAEIFTKEIPLSKELLQVCARHGWDSLELALTGGEDYELLFTMAPGTEPSVPCHVIGRITAGQDISWQGADRDYLGYRHF
jgi:thiamine-monophosphate kinase